MSDDMRAHLETLREAVEMTGHDLPVQFFEDRKRWRAALVAVGAALGYVVAVPTAACACGADLDAYDRCSAGPCDWWYERVVRERDQLKRQLEQIAADDEQIQAPRLPAPRAAVNYEDQMPVGSVWRPPRNRWNSCDCLVTAVLGDEAFMLFAGDVPSGYICAMKIPRMLEEFKRVA